MNLLGNHDDTMLHALSGDRPAATDWLFTGGRPALESYGIDPDSPRESWPEGVPTEHMAFLRDLTLTHREGGYLFVHGGVRPGVPLEQQAREDLLRMRQPFLYSEMSFGAVVVHGHSAGEGAGGAAQPDRHRHRRGVRRQDDLPGAGGRHFRASSPPTRWASRCRSRIGRVRDGRAFAKMLPCP